MRSTYFPFLLCVFVLSSSLLADDFAGFRIPTHRVKNITGSFSGRYLSQEDRYLTDYSGYSLSGRQWQADGSFKGSGYYLYDSDPWRLRLSANGYFTGTHNRSKTRQSDRWSNIATSDNKTKAVSEQWLISGDTRSYPFALPVGFLANFSGTGSYRQNWVNLYNDNRYGEPDAVSFHQVFGNSSDWIYRYDVAVDAGAGFGRVRDVTPVYDIYIVQKRLLDLGAITREPSVDAKQKLQDLYYFQNAYSTVHERSTKFFWQEVENILRADGALTDNRLDAYALYRIAENSLPPVSASNGYRYNSKDDFGIGEESGKLAPYYRTGSFAGSFLRERGYFVGIIGEVVHYNYIGRYSERERDVLYMMDTLYSDTTYPSRFTRRQQTTDVNSVGLMGEYHLPLGVHWQFDAMSQALLPQRKGYTHAFILRNQAVATYLIDDRWRADFRLRHVRQKFDYGKALTNYATPVDSWWTEVQASLRYFIEDRLSVSLNATQSQSSRTRGGFAVSPGSTNQSNIGFERVYDVSIGLSYHFLGELDAPGIVPAATLMPWAK